MSGIRFSKETQQKIITLYQEGMSQKDIATLLGTYNTSVRRVLIKHGIRVRGNSEVQNFVRENPFKEDSLSDYFLGLILTDGCISNNALSLSLKEEDVYMLENFARFLSNKVKVNKYFHKGHNKFQYYVKTRSDIVIEYLKTVAQFKNKSFDLVLYKGMNWNILRGVFDGDGGVVYLNEGKSLKWFICGNSMLFINQVYEFLRSNGYNPTITSSNGTYYVNLYRKKELLTLFNHLYSDGCTYLIRKYNILATFLEKSKMTNTLNSGND